MSFVELETKVERILEHEDRLTTWEIDFMGDMESLLDSECDLTEQQLEIIDRIYDKVTL